MGSGYKKDYNSFILILTSYNKLIYVLVRSTLVEAAHEKRTKTP
jgi:hypothetical protein